MKNIGLLSLVWILAFSSCAKVNLVEGGNELVDSHTSIAIIPTNVFNIVCDEDHNECYEYLDEESEKLYFSLAVEVANRNIKKKNKINLLPPSITLRKLDDAGIEYINTEDYKALCSILDVDAIIVSDFFVRQPSSVGASIATGVFSTILFRGFGGSSVTNVIYGNVFIYDNDTEQTIWSYEHEVKGNFLSSKSMVHKTLVKNVTKKLPYF